MKTTIGELFYIQYGQKEYHNKEWLWESEGDNILISSKGEDNGVYGFFDIKNNFEAPFITTPSTGTVGQAFVQEIDASVDDNCLVLLPKKKLSKEKLFQIAFQIRVNKWKYKYGRQITPERLSKQVINLFPFKKNLSVFEDSITPKKTKKITIKTALKTRVVKLKEIFKVVKGKGSYLEKLDTGNVPVISTKLSDNGVCGFYEITPSFKKYCITVGRIMCNPRVQLYDFATVPDDIFVLTPNHKVSKEFMFYASSIIKTEGWRFNYSRKVTKKRLESIDMPLPTSNGGFDHEYIGQVAKNSYGYGDL